MSGMFDLETRTRWVQAGEIDTVVTCFPDVQGRLLAKRVPDVPKTLRRGGDGHYAHAGEWDQNEYDRRVTDREPIRDFERAWGAGSPAIVPTRAGA